LRTVDPRRTSAGLRIQGKAGLPALFLLLFLACGGSGEEVEAKPPRADTVVDAQVPSAGENQETPPSTGPRIPFEERANRPLQIAEMGYNFGSADAPVKVLELSDFGCGYCRRFHEETFPSLIRIYMDAGLVEWKFIPYVLGRFPNGLEAATAAECAGEQDQFFPMQSRLFADQRNWRGSDEPLTLFSTLAADEGLDVERFDSCMEGGWRDTRVRENIRLGQQIGARGTPMFFVDGRMIPGALPLEDFKRVLDAALVQRGIKPPGGGASP